jgi:MOSC domain-containing protein YiiM
MKALLERFPRLGRVVWIGVRPERRSPLRTLEHVKALAGRGLDGDHYRGGSGARGVSLIQAEHLPVIAALVGDETVGAGQVKPSLLRRNLVVSGINLQALNGWRFSIGGAVLEGTGLCHPCSRMEQVLGAGGLNAMRGHGGLTARVLESGTIRLGDPVTALAPVSSPEMDP